jgi:hypothetical protein
MKNYITERFRNLIFQIHILILGPRICFLLLALEQYTNSLAFSPQSELYRLSDRHLLAKFSANFCG